MKISIITIWLILLSEILCIGQEKEKLKLNAVSLEVGKTGFIYNLNYDHKLVSNNLGFRFGAGSNLGIYLNLISVGGGAYHLLGTKNKFFELGLDVQYLIVNEVSNDQRGFASIFVYPDYSIKTFYPSLNLGYRRYRKSRLFRVGLSPGLIKREFVPGGYISYGFTF